ncbi:MAG TPA: dTDP-4-amino-4,6-dideoxygalactose transaminase [bacterium]|nr:dTDP-4-amino-4,6-dideoxygalactose transaminase [bacterium]
MIPFNKPPVLGDEIKYIEQVIRNGKMCGDNEFTKKCGRWIEHNFKTEKALMTPSCTDALEMSAILAEIQQGDEVIMPSYTFVSTANAFVLRGAKIVFVDIRPDTMNIDEKLIEQAVTSKTKAIVPVHYAGVSCEMDDIIKIGNSNNVFIIEDAAQGVTSTYKGKHLGTIGDLGAYSFHETKNYSGGEGGALIVNNKKLTERAEIIREKGTNRSLFLRGQVDKYTWVDIGSSFLPTEFSCAYLFRQLEKWEEINKNRLQTWDTYYKQFKELEKKEFVQLPYIPEHCIHNSHMFYMKVKNLEVRTSLIEYLKENGIQAVFHYIPLHSAPAGKKYGRFSGEDRYTTKESEKLLRLPIYYGMSRNDQEKVIDTVYSFFK